MQIAIYALLDKNYDTRYIGKTVYLMDRVSYHRRTKPWMCNYEVLENTEEENWEKREKFWIKWYKDRGYPLTNKTSGGQRGIEKHTEESKRKMSISHTGLKQTPEHIANIVAAITGLPRAKWNDESRKRNSEAHK